METSKTISKPTVYNGCHFRSRTEARWAVFFDTLGIKYYYEHEDFVLPNGERYLPDFYLPELNRGDGVFAEVKGVTFKVEEKIKCAELYLLSQKPVLMLDGPPEYREYDVFRCDLGDWECPERNLKTASGIEMCPLPELPFFSEGLVYFTMDDIDEPDIASGYGVNLHTEKQNILKAVNAARAARFEFL